MNGMNKTLRKKVSEAISCADNTILLVPDTIKEFKKAPKFLSSAPDVYVYQLGNITIIVKIDKKGNVDVKFHEWQ